MRETTIYCPDIECDSCVKLISRKLQKNSHIEEYKVNDDSVVIKSDVEEKKLIEIITDLGFRASIEPYERKNFKERIRHFKENKNAYLMEVHAAKYFMWSVLILLILQILAYYGLKDIFNMDGLLPWMIYGAISIASIATAMWHFYAYKIKVTCMVGMMVGMTVSMQSGMMIGAVLGATNGFFIGALIGMLLAVIVGIITGQCCGVMGVMEGMMGGVMGGTMGSMITVMMMADHVEIFMPIYIFINVIITLLMIYMVYEESIEGKVVVKNDPDFSTFISICIITVIFITGIMVFGPKNFLLGI